MDKHKENLYRGRIMKTKEVIVELLDDIEEIRRDITNTEVC